MVSVGILPRGGDWTASNLYYRFHDKVTSTPHNGCLAFWHNGSQHIIHVEFCLNADLCIGASGGGSRTKNKQDAIDQNAYIKIRPHKTRDHIFGFVDPFKD